jgi:hypothetical protein
MDPHDADSESDDSYEYVIFTRGWGDVAARAMKALRKRFWIGDYVPATISVGWGGFNQLSNNALRAVSEMVSACARLDPAV